MIKHTRESPGLSRILLDVVRPLAYGAAVQMNYEITNELRINMILTVSD